MDPVAGWPVRRKKDLAVASNPIQRNVWPILAGRIFWYWGRAALGGVFFGRIGAKRDLRAAVPQWREPNPGFKRRRNPAQVVARWPRAVLRNRGLRCRRGFPAGWFLRRSPQAV